MDALLLLLVPVIACLAMPAALGAAAWIWTKARRKPAAGEA